MRDTYEDWELRVERFIDAGNEEVVVLATYTGTGRGKRGACGGRARIRLDCRGRLGLCAFAGSSRTREALEAAGLEE